MKPNGIFIDLRNEKQVQWWNEIAGRLVKVVKYDTIVETATNEPVGLIIMIKGLLKDYVIKENKKFLSNPKLVKF